jgi:DNA repair protein RecN (Recombination protein N)
MEILDDYAGEALEKTKMQLRECYRRHQELQREYDSTDLDEKTRQREQELTEFEVREIEDAALTEGEDEILESDYRRMANSRKITEAVGEAAEILSGEAEEENASDAVSRALREINSVGGYDIKAQELGKQLSEVDSLLSDFCRALSEYMSDMEFDEEDFRHTEDRLNLINHLKDKYGATIAKILEYHDERQQHLEMLQDLDAHRIQVKKELEKTTAEALELCGKISQQRRGSAQTLAQKMKKALIDLNFLDVQFEIQVRPDEAHISANGYDDVEFMISTNPGESSQTAGPDCKRR